MSDPLTNDLVAQLRAERDGYVACMGGGFMAGLLGHAADEIERLRSALRSSPCTCTSQGTCSFPPQPSDHVIKHWCARCRELGYDKKPEVKPAMAPFTALQRSPE